MDFVLGRNTSYALSHNGNLLGYHGAEYPYFVVSHKFNFTSSSHTEAIPVTIDYYDGHSLTTALSRNTSYTYHDLLFGRNTNISRIGDITLFDYGTGAQKRNDPSYIRIMSRYPILKSVRHMIHFTSGNGSYAAGYSPIDLGLLNTASVTDFSEMFYRSGNGNTWWAFDKLDLSKLNTSNGVNFNSMIPTGYNMVIMTSGDKFIIDLSGFDMRKAVTQDSYNIFSDNFRSYFSIAIIVDRCDEDTVNKIKWACQTRATLPNFTVTETTVEGKRAIVVEYQGQ